MGRIGGRDFLKPEEIWVTVGVRVWECGGVGVWECGSVGAVDDYGRRLRITRKRDKGPILPRSGWTRRMGAAFEELWQNDLDFFC